MVKSVRLALAACLAGILGSCGGGGGGGGGVGGLSISYSASSINFQVDGPYSPTPLAQVLTGTLTGSASGTLFVIVEVNSPNLVTVDAIVTSDTQGQATFTPANPSALGAGTFTGTVVIKACLDDPTCATGQITGSPKTITVNYVIPSTVVADSVTPRVVTAGVPGSVVLRGGSLGGATSAALGATTATSLTVTSATELRVGYPALAAGSYPILLNSGAVSYAATLVVVPAPGYAPTTLDYSVNLVPVVRGLIYDSARQALLVAVDTPTGSEVLRFSFAGGVWSSPINAGIAELRDLDSAPDGSRILVTTPTAIVELDPVTLATGVTTSKPAFLEPTEYFKSLAVANDGNAIVSAPLLGGASGSLVSFNINARTFTRIDANLGNSVGSVSGDGTRVFNLSAVTPSVYDASTGLVTSFSAGPTTGFGSADVPVAAPVNFDGTLLLAGPVVINASLQQVGAASGSSYIAGTINPAGTRAYLVNTSNEIRTFNLSASPVGGFYPEIGSPVSIPDAGLLSTASQMTTTANGDTLFIAGFNGIVVVPAP